MLNEQLRPLPDNLVQTGAALAEGSLVVDEASYTTIEGRIRIVTHLVGADLASAFVLLRSLNRELNPKGLMIENARLVDVDERTVELYGYQMENESST